jgi:hypothetical protein
VSGLADAGRELLCSFNVIPCVAEEYARQALAPKTAALVR